MTNPRLRNERLMSLGCVALHCDGVGNLLCSALLSGASIGYWGTETCLQRYHDFLFCFPAAKPRNCWTCWLRAPRSLNEIATLYRTYRYRMNYHVDVDVTHCFLSCSCFISCTAVAAPRRGPGFLHSLVQIHAPRSSTATTNCSRASRTPRRRGTPGSAAACRGRGRARWRSVVVRSGVGRSRWAPGPGRRRRWSVSVTASWLCAL